MVLYKPQLGESVDAEGHRCVGGQTIGFLWIFSGTEWWHPLTPRLFQNQLYAHLLKLKRGEIRSQFLLYNNNFGDYQSHLRWWLHNAIMDPGFSNFILFSGILNMYLSPSSNKSSGQPLKLSSSSMQEEI